jgi:hypothetical protein
LREATITNDGSGNFLPYERDESGLLQQNLTMLESTEPMVRFMAFMQRSASQLSVGRGATARLGVVGLLALLAGCEGEVTMDLGTELPADPNINQVVVDIRGLEFTKSSGGTETLEFRASEPVDLIDLADDNGVFRLFTSEQLSEGTYTGVRLLFDEDRLDDAFVSTSAATPFPLNLADGDTASLSFEIQDNESNSESFTLLLDLRKSLSFDEGSREYTLTPRLRAVDSSEMSRIEGNVSVSCPAGSTLERGAVYLFQNSDVTPDDIDGAGVEPFATAPIFTSTVGSGFFYSLRYLPAGNYTIAVTCEGNDDEPLTDEDLRFRNAVNVQLDDRETITRDLL